MMFMTKQIVQDSVQIKHVFIDLHTDDDGNDIGHDDDDVVNSFSGLFDLIYGQLYFPDFITLNYNFSANGAKENLHNFE